MIDFELCKCPLLVDQRLTSGFSRGCGSPVVKVSDHGRHVTSSSPVPLKTRRGYTDRADSYYLYPYGNNVNDSEMANLPTDMELQLALSQRNSTRTPSPQLTPCEQLKYNKAQLAKMETFRRFKQACVDALIMMPDHYSEEHFYVRALTDLQDVEETMALAEINLSPNKFALPQGAQINNLENTGPVASGSNLASTHEVTPNNGSNNSANQNAPQNQLPPPIMLFIEENYKVQMAVITKEFPKIRSRLKGDFLKLYTDSAEERRLVVQLLKRLKFQLCTIKANAERPIKVVIKGLPRTTNPEEIKQDLEMLGYTPERVIQLIGRKTKRALPIFLITLPRNLDNLKIFDLKTLSYLSIRVEGYDGRNSHLSIANKVLLYTAVMRPILAYASPFCQYFSLFLPTGPAPPHFLKPSPQGSRREERHIVVFSDESRFDLSSDDNRIRVWRPRGERLNPAFALQRHTTPTADGMIWGAITYNTRSPLVTIRGTMAAQRYVHTILQPHVLPLMQRLPGAPFQQDNVRPHTASVSQECFRTVIILPWRA
ncbi:transposable element Tcb2 transposase [Trichonephila clavipes]|nr:transposable element Tcb2 transposase [Trichonephila clavipes]